MTAADTLGHTGRCERGRPAWRRGCRGRRELTWSPIISEGGRSYQPRSALALGIALARRRSATWPIDDDFPLDFFALGQQRVDLLAQVFQTLVALVHAGESDV